MTIYLPVLMAHTSLMSYITNSMEHSVSYNLRAPQLVKKLSTFYEIQRFTTDRHLSLSSTRLIHSTPSHHISFFNTHFCYPPFYAQVFQVVSFLHISPLKPNINFCATCSNHLIPLILGERHKSWSSPCTALQYADTSNFLGPSTFLGDLFRTPSVSVLL